MSKMDTEQPGKGSELETQGSSPKRPYQPPQLRRLGTVAELTRGGASGQPDPGAGLEVG